jgi:Pentapeptide repeats (8 copies)
VQAALTVLGRCERPRSGPRRLDLTNTDLRRALLGEAKLQHTDLTGARLQGADLYGAQLQRAKLVGARLQEAYLVDAQLEDAILVAPSLPGVELDGAQCSDKTGWPVGFDWKKAGVRLVVQARPPHP